MATKPTYEEMERRVDELEREVSARRESEEDQREGERRFREFFQKSRDGFVVVDLQGRFMDANPAYCDMLGYSLDELKQKTDFYEITPEQWRDWERREIWEKRLLQEGYSGIYEKEYIRKNGTIFPVELQSYTVLNHDGNPLYLWGIARDVSIRRAADAALAESEARLRCIFDTSSDAILVFDAEGRIVMTNPAAAALYGYEEGEMIGLTGRDIVHPDCHHLFESFRRACLQEGRFQAESVDIRKDGTSFAMEVHGSLFEYKGTHHLLAMVRDVTERKRAEAALRQSEAKYREIYENAQVGIFRTRLSDGKVLECNDRFAETYGFETREACMTDCVFSVRYVDAGTRERMLAQVLEFGEVNNFEARFFRKDGAIVWGRFSARAHPQEGFLEGIGYEVTAEKKGLEAVKASEEKYRQIFENIQDVYYESAIDGTILEISPSVEQISRYTRQELIGKSLLEIYTRPQDRDAFLREVLAHGKTRDFEVGLTDKDGSPHICSVTSLLIRDGQGNPVKLIGSFRDISERKRAEDERKGLQEQLHRAQKMESLGLMAGGIAHDLNNILSGIVSYPDLLLMDLPADSPIRRPIETIRDSGMRAADVVADLLTIARGVATGRESVNLNRMVTGYLASPEHQRIVGNHAFVDFKIDLASDLLNVKGSVSHLRKSVMNLVLNAAEAIQGPGAVLISTRNRYLEESLKGHEHVQPGEYIVLMVSDTGSGISPEDLDRIFEPFYTKKVMGRSGTGLGLAVVWNTVHDHGGRIHVTTSEQGTRFELYFPVTREAIPEEKGPAAIEGSLGRGETILVVDDEAGQREIACSMLTKLGYRAEAVSGGEAALEYVKSHPVDLLVLDMVMPQGMDGRKTYEKIIEVHPGQKAILASGYARTQEVEAAQRLGAGRYIKKPYTLETIARAVREELDQAA